MGPSVDVRAALARSYLLDELPPEALDREAYGDSTYACLAVLEGRWDPENLFRHNHNVVPVP